jgi:hypothetical protein
MYNQITINSERNQASFQKKKLQQQIKCKLCEVFCQFIVQGVVKFAKQRVEKSKYTNVGSEVSGINLCVVHSLSYRSSKDVKKLTWAHIKIVLNFRHSPESGD